MLHLTILYFGQKMLIKQAIRFSKYSNVNLNVDAYGYHWFGAG